MNKCNCTDQNPFRSSSSLSIHSLRDPLDRASARNAVLPQLAAELYIPYAEGTLDAFGLYIYGIVLKALRSSAAPAGLTTRSPTSVMYDQEQSELQATWANAPDTHPPQINRPQHV